jgi:hypothetical protein
MAPACSLPGEQQQPVDPCKTLINREHSFLQAFPATGGACCLANAASAGKNESSRQQQQAGDPTKQL